MHFRLKTAAAIVFLAGMTAFGQTTQITLNPDSLAGVIDANIYGQFAEHLGHCIYGGIWVGPDSPIPNTRGIRNDVVDALKKLEVPVLRWPGGCFADEYHWMDGIGPREDRPKMVNTNWGGVVEDNSFGTHEFLDFCELIGAEAYISGNIGSGTVREFQQWVEYVTSDGENPMANLRKKNGRDKPWKVKYWGVGNESWGCGGGMCPEYYSALARRYSTFIKNYGDNQVYKIGSGPNIDDTTWTDVVMRRAGKVLNGLGLHYYTSNSRPAADFDEAGWFDVIKKTLRMDEIIRMHSRVMDKYDPSKRVALIVDEWGTWHSVEPGTNESFLYQQNTMRDAIVAAANLNIFHRHNDRVRMTNIAQMVNVLQAMILTDGDKMVLTPTYHVFEMYKKHQDAINLALDVETSRYTVNGESIPAVNASASIDSQGLIHLSLCNVNPTQNEKVTVSIRNFESRNVTARVLTSGKMNAMNSFDRPVEVVPEDFADFESAKDKLVVNMPSKSVIVLEISGEIKSTIGNALKVRKPRAGLKYTYHEGVLMLLPDFATMNTLSEGVIDQFVMPEESGRGDFAVRYSGYIKLPENGFYNFYVNSDDGAKLYLDGKLLINNDGRHAPEEVKGFASLKKGFHKIELEFFQAGGGLALDVSVEGPGLGKQVIPADMLFHEND